VTDEPETAATQATDVYLAVPVPRGPWFITQHDARALRENQHHTWERVYRYWPVLTPDGGVIMCSTTTDAQRVADLLNELTARGRQ
jgi:hypothetical protein